LQPWLLKFISFLLALPDEMEEKFEQNLKDTYLKSDDMTTLKSDRFSNMLHLHMYGETFEERLKREPLPDKLFAAEQLLIETNLPVGNIAAILKISKEVVIAIQIRLTNKD